MFGRLKENVGAYKAILLAGITCFLWFACVMRVVDDRQFDMLLTWSSGLVLAIVFMPVISRHKLAYHVLISLVGIVLVASAIIAKFLPRAQRDEIALVLCVVAGFYCHSVLWVYGNYKMPKTLDEFLKQWRQKRCESIEDVESADFDNDL